MFSGGSTSLERRCKAKCSFSISIAQDSESPKETAKMPSDFFFAILCVFASLRQIFC